MKVLANRRVTLIVTESQGINEFLIANHRTGKGNMAAHYIINAPDIVCEGCANSIRKALGRLNGVLKVDIDIDLKRVDTEYDPGEVSQDALAERLTQAGFPPGRS